MQDEGAFLCAFDLHACIGPFSIHRAAVITRIHTFHPIANSIQLSISQSNWGTDSDARSLMKRRCGAWIRHQARSGAELCLAALVVLGVGTVRFQFFMPFNARNSGELILYCIKVSVYGVLDDSTFIQRLFSLLPELLGFNFRHCLACHGFDIRD